MRRNHAETVIRAGGAGGRKMTTVGLRVAPKFGRERAHEAGIPSIAHRVFPDYAAVVGEEFE